MASLVESGKYGAINTTDTTTNVFYVIMFTSGEYTLHDNTKIYGQIITLVIYLYYNKLSHPGVQHHHYPEHDTVCLPI